jgi:hypothetical protein
LITTLIPLILAFGIFVGLMLSSVWRLWDKAEREIIRSEPLVGPVRQDGAIVAATLDRVGFVPSPRSWYLIPGFGWQLLNLVRPDGTTAEIVCGGRNPACVFVTRFADGRRLLSSRTGFQPMPSDVLRQTFPDADISELLRHHDESLAALRLGSSSLLFSPADVDRLAVNAELEAIAYVRQRRIRNGLGLVWRQLTRSHLDRGPVDYPGRRLE